MSVNERGKRPDQIKTKDHKYIGNKVEFERGKGVDSYTIQVDSIDPRLTDELCRVIAGALMEFGEQLGAAELEAIENVKREMEKAKNKPTPTSE